MSGHMIHASCRCGLQGSASPGCDDGFGSADLLSVQCFRMVYDPISDSIHGDESPGNPRFIKIDDPFCHRAGNPITVECPKCGEIKELYF